MVHIKASFPHALSAHAAIPSFIATIHGYFALRQSFFSADLDWTGHSGFSVAVWKVTRTIPLGATKTYRWVSDRIGRDGASRAVGSALARNPFPLVVPCHRVVRHDGDLGGFSGPGGVLLKRKLLEHEGVMFDEKGRVVLSNR